MTTCCIVLDHVLHSAWTAHVTCARAVAGSHADLIACGPAHALETGDVLEGINTFARSYARDGTPTSGVVQLQDWLGLDISGWRISDTVCTFDPTSKKFYFGFVRFQINDIQYDNAMLSSPSRAPTTRLMGFTGMYVCGAGGERVCMACCSILPRAHAESAPACCVLIRA